MPICIVYAYASCTGQLYEAHGFAQIGIRAVMHRYLHNNRYRWKLKPFTDSRWLRMGRSDH